MCCDVCAREAIPHFAWPVPDLVVGRPLSTRARGCVALLTLVTRIVSLHIPGRFIDPRKQCGVSGAGPMQAVSQGECMRHRGWVDPAFTEPRRRLGVAKKGSFCGSGGHLGRGSEPGESERSEPGIYWNGSNLTCSTLPDRGRYSRQRRTTGGTESHLPSIMAALPGLSS